jgi:hypothetical protein
MKTEYASTDRRGVSSAYEGLARWAGVSLATVVDYAREDRLGELVESRQYIRPMSGAEALRRLDEKRHAPGDKPRTPATLLGELRARKAIWDAEDRASYRHRLSARECLEIIQAKKWVP